MKVRHFIVWFGCLLLALQSVWAQNKLYIPEKTECIIGETCEIPVYLDNTDVILGIQIDLDLESIQEYLTSSPIFTSRFGNRSPISRPIIICTTPSISMSLIFSVPT